MATIHTAFLRHVPKTPYGVVFFKELFQSSYFVIRFKVQFAFLNSPFKQKIFSQHIYIYIYSLMEPIQKSRAYILFRHCLLSCLLPYKKVFLKHFFLLKKKKQILLSNRKSFHNIYIYSLMEPIQKSRAYILFRHCSLSYLLP